MARKHDERAAAPAPSALRDVERPRGAPWRALQADGIEWEGQVLIVGADLDLAARLILTKRRLALVRGGQIALDLPRGWLQPAPEMLAENGIRVSITPDEPAGEPDTLLLRARDGRGSAAQLVALLSGRQLSWEAPPALSAGHGMWDEEPEPAEPRWDQRVGAAPAIALPPLPGGTTAPSRREPSAADLDAATFGPFNDEPRTPAAMSYRGRTPTSISDWASRYLDEPVAGERPMRAVTVDDNGIYPEGGEPNDRVMPVPYPDDRRGGSRALVWSLRIAILLILLGTATYFGRDRLPFALAVPDWHRAAPATQTASSDNQVSHLSADQATTVAQTGGDNQIGKRPVAATEPTATQSAQQARATEPPAGVGGTISDTAVAPPPTEEAANQIVPTEPAEQVVATEPPATTPPTAPVEDQSTNVNNGNEPASAGNENVIPAVTEEATQVPTAPPTQAPTTPPTPRPTQAPTTPPTEAATVAPTQAATEPPTEVPSPTATATLAPTTTPAATGTTTPAQTATATVPPSNTATVTATAAPSSAATAAATTAVKAPQTTPAATGTLEPQPPSFTPDETPAQQAVSGSFRYSIEGMERGYSLPDLPEIADVGYGEWVVIAMYGQNWSAKDQVFDMSRFTLVADGQEIKLDTGNAWVAGLLGLKPAYGNTDAVLFAPNEGHRFALTFLIPSDAKQLTLVAGDQSFDLNVTTQTAPTLAHLPEKAPAPNLLAATVVKVESADTIVVDVNGTRQTVRYLGIDVPDGNACYAAEATKANEAVVAGKTVYLERQSTNADPHGTWVRDVWTMDKSGGYQLAATQLVAAGAAVADISRPNVQFADWLTSVEQQAKAAKKGLWADCGGLKSAASAGMAPDAPAAVLPQPDVGRVAARRRRTPARA